MGVFKRDTQMVLKKKKKTWLQCKRPGFDPWVRKIPWRKRWLNTKVLLPEEFHGLRSLAGYSPQGLQESGTTKQLTLKSDTSTNSQEWSWAYLGCEEIQNTSFDDTKFLEAYEISRNSCVI